MTRKAFAVHERADADFDVAVDYYLGEAGETVAGRFVDSVMSAHQLIAENPEVGSRRIARELSLPALRTVKVRGFPYLVAYSEIERDVEILRLIHGQRDLSPDLFDLGE